jgi:hypothetical protein
LFYLSNAECINLDQITSIIDRGQQIEIYLSDGKCHVIKDDEKLKAFRVAAGLKT